MNHRMKNHPLNDELALLTGYQWRVGGVANHKCRFLCPPDTPEGCELAGVNAPTWTMDQVYPLATGDETICADYFRHILDYCGDDGDCMKLQRQIANHPQVHAVVFGKDGHCEIQFGTMHLARGKDEDPRIAFAQAARNFYKDLAAGPLYDPLAPEPADDDLPRVGKLPEGWQELETVRHDPEDVATNDLVTKENLYRQIDHGVVHLQNCIKALHGLGVTAYQKTSIHIETTSGVNVFIGEIPEQVRRGYGWPGMDPRTDPPG